MQNIFAPFFRKSGLFDMETRKVLFGKVGVDDLVLSFAAVLNLEASL
jgi:hypothetical protein